MSRYFDECKISIEHDLVGNEKSALIFLLNDLQRSTMQAINEYEYVTSPLCWSGDGYRAFMSISSYVELIKDEKCTPSMIAILGFDAYENWSKSFDGCFTIQERAIRERIMNNHKMPDIQTSKEAVEYYNEVKEREKEVEQTIKNEGKKSNYRFLLESFDELRKVARNKDILFKSFKVEQIKDLKKCFAIKG